MGANRDAFRLAVTHVGQPVEQAMRFLEKSSALDDSDHCTPMPMVSVSTATASRARACPTPAVWLTVVTIGTP